MEGAGGDVWVGLEGAAVDAEGGGVLVEVAARDLDGEGELYTCGGVLLLGGAGFKVNFACGVGGDDVAGEDEIVKEPHVIGFLCHHLNSSRLVRSIILFQHLHN